MIAIKRLDQLDPAETYELLEDAADLNAELEAALRALCHYRPTDLDQRPEPERQAWWAAERLVRENMRTN